MVVNVFDLVLGNAQRDQLRLDVPEHVETLLLRDRATGNLALLVELSGNGLASRTLVGISE